MINIINEALAIQASGGEDAVVQWYEGLPPEQRVEFMEEMTGIIKRVQEVWNGAIQPVLAAFAQSINEWAEDNIGLITSLGE